MMESFNNCPSSSLCWEEREKGERVNEWVGGEIKVYKGDAVNNKNNN